jgi:hypothetical protein
MKHHGPTVLLLLLAIGSYALGIGKASVLFLVVGCILEVMFWVRLLRRKRKLGRDMNSREG